MVSIARRLTAAALTGLLAAGALQLLPGPALAVDAPTPGAALPTLYAPQPWAGVAGASSDYVLVGGGNLYDEIDPRLNYATVRTSDGQVADSFTTPWGQETRFKPTLVRDSVVTLVSPSDGHYQVEVRSAANGSLTRSLDITGIGSLLHGDPQFAMVAYSTGPSSGDNGVKFVHADGSVATVPGNFFSPPTWIGGDATTAYITSFEGDFALDVATGAKTALTFADGARLQSVGPTYLIGAVANPGGVPGAGIRTLKRTDLTPGWSFTLAHDPDSRALYPAGDGLVEAYLRSDAPSASYLSLRPINTGTGARGADLATNTVYDTSGIATMDDGRLALTLTDGGGPTGGGRIGVLANGAISTLAPLPDVPETADSIALNGSTVSLTWERRDGIWTTASNGAGTWTQSAGDPGYVVADAHKRLWVRGDVVMSLSEHAIDNNDRWRLRWPGGTRDILSPSAALSHGGTYVSYYVPGTSNVKVENAKTGAQIGNTLTNQPQLPVIDGDVLWYPPVNGGLYFSNLATGQGGVVQLGSGCTTASVEDVRGRWAWITCGTTTRVDKVIDVFGVVDPLVLPADSGATGRGLLGDGYVAMQNYVPDTNPGRSVLEVTDLVSKEKRTYGYLRGISPTGATVAVNDGSAPGLAYLDSTSQPRVVDLSWVGAPPPVDTTPPVLTSSPPLAPLLKSTKPSQLQLGWTWSGGATTWDLRIGDRAGNNWTEPIQYQYRSYADAPTVGLSLPPGYGACFSARARDAAGNVSDWSPKVCQYVDGRAPKFGALTGTAIWPAALRPAITFKATATDDDKVASYDVERRNAPPGKALGSWVRVADAVSSASASTGVQSPGSEVCFRARARDAAGNVSAWTAARCVHVPIDDRAFVRGRGVTARTASIALARTYLQLSGTGSSVTTPRQTGNTIGLWILRAPGLGSADVLVGGRRVGTIGFAASSARRVLVTVTVPGGFVNTPIKIVSRGAKAVRVDGIAIAR